MQRFSGEKELGTCVGEGEEGRLVEIDEAREMSIRLL